MSAGEVSFGVLATYSTLLYKLESQTEKFCERRKSGVLRLSLPTTMVDTQDVDYLSSLLGMQLRVHTTDDRMFVGEFRCTDNVMYHQPLPPLDYSDIYTGIECHSRSDTGVQAARTLGRPECYHRA